MYSELHPPPALLAFEDIFIFVTILHFPAQLLSLAVVALKATSFQSVFKRNWADCLVRTQGADIKLFDVHKDPSNFNEMNMQLCK